MISTDASKLMSALRPQSHIFLNAMPRSWRFWNSIKYRYNVEELQNPGKTFSCKESLEISLAWLGNFTNLPEIPQGTFVGVGGVDIFLLPTLFLSLTYRSIWEMRTGKNFICNCEIICNITLNKGLYWYCQCRGTLARGSNSDARVISHRWSSKGKSKYFVKLCSAVDKSSIRHTCNSPMCPTDHLQT